MGGIIIIATIVLTIVLNIIYHKIFRTVVYFSFRALLKEWVTCLFAAFIIVALVFAPFMPKDWAVNVVDTNLQNTVSAQTRNEVNHSDENYDDYDTLEDSEKIFSDEQLDFAIAHMNFFPVGQDDWDELESYIDYDLDYDFMCGNLQKCSSRFAFLENLQVTRIWLGQDGLNEMELEDSSRNLYHLFCPYMEIHVVEGDTALVVAMPIAAGQDPVEVGDDRIALIMLASLVEVMSDPKVPGGDSSGYVTAGSAPWEIPGDAKENPYQDSVLLWKSFYEPLTEADVAGLDASDLRIARNEIYAAYGRQFSSEDLQAYFEEKDWYNGTVPPSQFSEEMLTEVQKANIALISSHEQ